MASPSNAILVTGGAGYIGSHTCKALAAQGYLPVAFDNLSTGHADFLKWGPSVQGDIVDFRALSDTLRRFNISAVIHFAALALVGDSMKRPEDYYRTNVTGTLNVLEAMRQAGVKNLVFSSSCATYGAPDQVPITEDTLQRPINPYGSSKLMCERIAFDFARTHDLSVSLLRYFNASGADADAEIGEDHGNETHLIPRAILSALGRIDDFEVFGNDYPTPDGTAVRDYIHVTDLATAHIAALKALQGGANSEAFNVGSGEGHSVLDVLKAIEGASGRSFAAVKGPRRAGDPPELVADATKIKQHLGFTPQHSDLNNVITSAWKWHNKRHGNA